MEYPNEVLEKRIDTPTVAWVFNCSSTTVNKWRKEGLPYREGNSTCWWGRFEKKPNKYLVRDIVNFLEANNKERYLKSFQRYLESHDNKIM